MPKGSTKEAISLLTPSSSTVVFSFNDNAAEEAAAEKPKRATLAIFS